MTYDLETRPHLYGLSIQENQMAERPPPLARQCSDPQPHDAHPYQYGTAPGAAGPVEMTTYLCRGVGDDTPMPRQMPRPENPTPLQNWGETTADTVADTTLQVDLTEAERLGLLVGQAYGTALAERDQARALADAAVGHLARVLDTTPAGTFATTNAAVDAAREFLESVRSPQTPTQETT